MTEAAISKKDKLTVGEELFLVHLKRCREEELEKQDREVFGTSPPRKRSNSTVGEELWEIHRRRSQGMPDDLDRDVDDHDPAENVEKKAVLAPAASKGHEAKVCARYNLRSKDAPRKKA